MSTPVPQPDIDLRFPHLTVVSASAGSGKTTALTRRYVQFLLSSRIQHRKPRHLLAITFTNNAATEMKQRILSILKKLALGDAKEIEVMAGLVDVDPAHLPQLAHRALDDILVNYTEFQVRTIDSFLTTVFRSTAIDLGFSPAVRFELHPEGLMTRAIREFSERIGRTEGDLQLLRDLVSLAEEGRRDDTKFLWDPYATIADNVHDLSRHLASLSQPIVIPDLRTEAAALKKNAIQAAAALRALLEASGLQLNKLLLKDLDLIQDGEIAAVTRRSIKIKATNKPKNRAEQEAETAAGPGITEALEQLNVLLADAALVESRRHYIPYARALRMMDDLLLEMKRKEQVVFLEDVNASLRAYFAQNLVPELYIKLGERIHHFLIDEFQDTSPAQWEALRPLLDNSLSEGGSLFVVGDMKQSIFSFRGADWKIMRSVMDGRVFPSAPADVQTLDTNYRSEPALLDATAQVFHQEVPASAFAPAANATGLSSYTLKPSRKEGEGHVEIIHIERDRATKPEFRHVADLVLDAHNRGHAWGDIAVLSPANAPIVELSSVLNSDAVPFVSQSSLDIRNRKVIQEILSLLTFLDTPVDNSAFASVATSELLAKAEPEPKNDAVRDLLLRATEEKGGLSLYKEFGHRFPDVWARRFEHLFKKVGYLPLYDLVCGLVSSFDVLRHFPREEASIVRFLECVREFESEGSNAVRDFVREAESGENGLSWELPRPAGRDAVTLMTIHKAKGLGFPVVISLLYDWKKRGGKPVVREDEQGAELYRISDGWERHPILQELKAQTELAYQADELNKLYVALTRAKSEMYVVVATENAEKPPALFLTPTPEERTRPHVRRMPEKEHPVVPVHIAQRTADYPEAQDTRLSDEGARRGELFHEILSRIPTVDTPEASLAHALAAVTDKTSTQEMARVHEILTAFLSEPTIDALFRSRPGRTVACEKEVAERSGRLYRIDRLIVDPEEVTIVDFKTGGRENEAAYTTQVLGYMNICTELYPGKKIRGIIAYVDTRIIVTVS